MRIKSRNEIRLKIGALIFLFCFLFAYSPFGIKPTNLGNQTQKMGFDNSLGVSDQSENNWSMFRGNLNHTGATSTNPQISNGPIWNYTTGGDIISSPAVSNGMVYFGSFDDNFYCLNALTGAQEWTYSTGSEIYSSPAISNGLVYFGSEDHNLYCLNASNGILVWKYTAGDRITPSPAVSEGYVYFGSNDGNLYCLNATSGNLKWNYNTGSIGYSSPAIVNGFVYIGSENNSLFCLNASTGNFIWEYTANDEIESSPSVSNGYVYVGSNDGNIYCLNSTIGSLNWNYSTNGWVRSSPSIVDDRAYVGSRDGNLYCLNSITGTLIWKHLTGDMIDTSSAAVSNGLIYVGSNDYKFYCLNATTGDLQWNYTTGNGAGGSSPAIFDGNVYVGSHDHNLYCFPMILSPTGGEWSMFHGNLNHTGYTETSIKENDGPIWCRGTGYYIASSPAIAYGNVYIGSEDDYIYCFNASTGAVTWFYITGNAVESSPAVTDGMVYVGSGDHNLYCLNATTGNLIWKYTTGNIIDRSSPAISNGMVYFGSWDHNLYCLNATTGNLIWKYATGGEVDSSPAISNGMVYVGSDDDHVYCLNATNGTQIWNYTTGGDIDSAPAISNGMIYVGSENNNLYCLNANTGDFVWYHTWNYGFDSSPAIAYGNVYIGDGGGNIYCYDAETGADIWSFMTSGSIESSPAVTDGMVYIGSGDHNLYCLNAGTGNLIWNYTTGDWILSSPAIANGMVYVGSNDCNLYCLPMILTNASSVNHNGNYTNYETTYLNFEDNYVDQISGTTFTSHGTGTSFVSGIVGNYAINFNGNGYLDSPYTFDNNEIDRSFSFWTKIPANGGGEVFTAGEDGDNGGADMSFWMNSTNINFNGLGNYFNENVNFTPNTWYFLCLVYTNSNQSIQLWINNELVSSHILNYSCYIATNELTIGAWAGLYDGRYTLFNGSIDDFRYFENYALNPQDINSLYSLANSNQNTSPNNPQNLIIILIAALIIIIIITFISISSIIRRKNSVKRNRIKEQEENARIRLQQTLEKEKNEQKQRMIESFQSRISEVSPLIDSCKYNEAISELEKLKEEALSNNIPEIISLAENTLDKARNEQKQHVIGIFKSRIEQTSHLIESGKYDEAISELGKIQSDAQSYNIPQISSLAERSLKDAQMFKNLVRMFKVSSRLKIDDICEQLERSRKEMLKIFFDWGDKFGVKIEGDFITINSTDNLDSMMTDLLQRSFDDWSDKEKTKEGKI